MIDPPRLVWGAPDWLSIAGGIAAVLLALLAVGYWRAGATRAVRLIAAALKLVAIFILLMCLIEPLFAGSRARPGANQFAVLADNSQSMTLKDQGAGQTRAQQLKSLTTKDSADSAWLERIGRDFDLRQFAFDSQLHPVDNFETLTFDGRSSDLAASLDRLLRRFQGRPLAGVLLLTDGSATDAAAIDQVLAHATAAGEAPVPIYPVLVGGQSAAADISLERVSVSQTNFEDAPVTLAAQIVTSGYAGRNITAELLSDAGKSLEMQSARVEQDGQPLIVRFRVKPEQPGLSFYRVRVAADGKLGQFDHPETSDEATLANNTLMAAVDRGRGPFKVLYVSGRPNWEYKFLERSIAGDDQVQLTGLIRVAKREPKFNFINLGDRMNPLFRGFETPDKDQAEQYDQPVIMRVTADEIVPRASFPKTAEELDAFHALILDDVESEFFSQDQMQLIKEFVRQRGGALLMLGGLETFKNGKYDRTPIGDLLPVYFDEIPTYPPDARFRFLLTREGWLEPWLRLRPDEDAENRRLDAMGAPFLTLNAVRGIKPGATVLARAVAENGTPVPALVEQHFGKGRAAALLLGDLWKWEMHRATDTDTDFEKAWRQTVRWLVSDVPQRIEAAVDAVRRPDDAEGALHLVVQVRDATYGPLDNAAVTVRITAPDQKSVEMRAEAAGREPGRYEALYVPRQPGAYRAQITVAAPDGSEVGQTQAGWTSDPAADEFRNLQPNMALLERIAKATGGQVVDASQLDAFAASLPTRRAQITEPFVQPFWHQSWVFLLAIACLGAEWGLRRWKGLP